MIFIEVLEDIKKLIGLPLQSIKPGAGITIISVDIDHGNLFLRTNQGVLRSRPLIELERIWDELQKNPAVHVDRVLNGSGTSRNQPETILANLPYIEWAKIHNKKHLVLVKEKTHAYGTLRQMDAPSTANILRLIDKTLNDNHISFVVVNDDIKTCVYVLQDLIGGSVTAKEQGVYVLESSSKTVLFTTPSISGLAPGSYPMIKANYNLYGSNKITISNMDFYIVKASNMILLVDGNSLKKSY